MAIERATARRRGTRPDRPKFGVPALVTPKPADLKKAGIPAANIAPNFKYNGGPIVVRPQIFVSFWGTLWGDAAHKARAQRIQQYYVDLLNSEFMNVLSQYGVGMGARDAGMFVRANFHNVTSTNLSDSDIHTQIQGLIDGGDLPEGGNPTNNVLMIHLDENIGVNDAGLGVTMCEAQGDTAFGYHFHFNTRAGHPFYYAVIPALGDGCLTESCPNNDAGCSLHLAQTQEQRDTQVASHEFAEMTTDPQLNAWTDP